MSEPIPKFPFSQSAECVSVLTDLVLGSPWHYIVDDSGRVYILLDDLRDLVLGLCDMIFSDDAIYNCCFECEEK